MANYNRVIMMGNLTRDPQLSYLPSQTPVCEIGLAVNRRWRDAQGQQREDTCFIDCRAFGKQAETLNQYMSKGKPILVEGRLDYDTWEAQDGSKRSKHRITIERFQFVGGPGDSGGGYSGGGDYSQTRQASPAGGAPRPPQQQQPQQGPPPSSYDDDGGFGGEDIPF
jgi:single-strand DNA-binding protein